MQKDPFTQSTQARLVALRHQLRAVERGVRAEQSGAVPDLATLQRHATERQRLAGEIARHEGILHSLGHPVSPSFVPGRRGA